MFSSTLCRCGTLAPGGTTSGDSVLARKAIGAPWPCRKTAIEAKAERVSSRSS